MNFNEKLESEGLEPLRATALRTLQLNLGYGCNLSCNHCHVEAGPERTEAMSREVMESSLRAFRDSPVEVMDITGGAPEGHPHYRWLVERASAAGKRLMVRTNLSAIMQKGNRDLPLLYARKGVEVVASLPCYLSENVDGQRGKGVFEDSIKALRALNMVGYGKEGSGLKLHLVYNPAGPSLPPDQATLEADYKRELKARNGIIFTGLYVITNMPIGRFSKSLESEGKLDSYMEKLSDFFNVEAAQKVMCRNSISVAWNGILYDCDFNQALGLRCLKGVPGHIDAFDYEALSRRDVLTASHCYGCAAGAGSSCTGATI